MKALNRYLDHAVLKPEMSRDESTEAIELGLTHDTRTVCVRPCDIALAADLCRGTNTGVCATLAFPHGCAHSQSKIDEAKQYARERVDEVDMVANYGAIRSGEWDYFESDITGVFTILHTEGIPLKVILETSMLSIEQITQATRICASTGVEFVKTSTGFNGGGATVPAVQAMLDAADNRIRVKASGGIRSRQDALQFIAMGCDRLGVGYSTTPVLLSESPSNSGDGY